MQKLRIKISETMPLGWLNYSDTRKLYEEIEELESRLKPLREVTIADAPPELGNDEAWAWVNGYEAARQDMDFGRRK